MDISLNGTDSLLPFAIIGIILVVIIVVVFFLHRSGKRRYLKQDKDTSSSVPGQPLDHQPEAKPGLVVPSGVKPTTSAKAAVVTQPEDIDFTTSCKDLTESLVLLSEKYSLDIFTIATADGLIIGSSVSDAAQNDAATYSEQFKNNPLAETPGIVLFGLTHKGSELIGIIRTKTPLPENIVKHITSDTKVILNWWI